MNIKNKKKLLICHFILILFCLGIIINFINFNFDSNPILKIHTINYTIPHLNGTILNDEFKYIHEKYYDLHFQYIDIKERKSLIINANYTIPPTFSTPKSIPNESPFSKVSNVQRLYFNKNSDQIYLYYKTYLIIHIITIFSTFFLTLISTFYFIYYSNNNNYYYKEIYDDFILNNNNNNNKNNDTNIVENQNNNNIVEKRNKIINALFKIGLLVIVIPMIGFSMYLVFNPIESGFKESFRIQVKQTPILNSLCFDANGVYFGICEIFSNQNQANLLKLDLNLKDKNEKDDQYLYIWEKYEVTMNQFYYKSYTLAGLVLLTSTMMSVLFALIDKKKIKLGRIPIS
ncbi:hypothetical protein ACTFIZ_007866 [Dictyostelium cf. discoideum]